MAIKNFFIHVQAYWLFFMMMFIIHNQRINHYRKTGKWAAAVVRFNGEVIVRYEDGKPGFLLGEKKYDNGKISW